MPHQPPPWPTQPFPDGNVITPSTMIGVIAEGALIEVHGHLTDITTLRQVQGIPD